VAGPSSLLVRGGGCELEKTSRNVRVCKVLASKFQVYVLDKGFIEMLGFVIVLASSGLCSQLGFCDI
jgi:hypothetical protein